MTTVESDELFLDETLALAGFDPKEDDFALLKEDLRPLLEERIALKVYEALPSDEDRAKFDEFMTSDEETNPAEIEEFFTSKIPNFDDFMGQVYVDFQHEYLEVMKEK
jgi:hypothetical protein